MKIVHVIGMVGLLACIVISPADAMYKFFKKNSLNISNKYLKEGLFKQKNSFSSLRLSRRLKPRPLLAATVGIATGLYSINSWNENKKNSAILDIALAEPIYEQTPSSIIKALSNDEKIDDKRKLFKNDCNLHASKNRLIPIKDSSTLRIMTYNVHMWRTPHGRHDNTHAVFDIIDQLNPDVCILQESSPEHTLENSVSVQQLLEQRGYTVTFCKAPHFIIDNTPFGNILAYKKKHKGTATAKTFRTRCKGEGRCFVKAKLDIGTKLMIYGTHLDVYDNKGTTRAKQILEIIEQNGHDTDYPTIIAGDFNAVRKQDYNYSVNDKNAWNLVAQEYKQLFKTPMSTHELEILEKKGFMDCFTKAGLQGPAFTVWTGTVVDFLFLNKHFNFPIKGCYVYYSDASDHLPVIMDLAVDKK